MQPLTSLGLALALTTFIAFSPSIIAVGMGGDCGANVGDCDTTQFLKCDSVSLTCVCDDSLFNVSGMCKSPLDAVCDDADTTKPKCDDSSYLTCQTGFCKCNATQVDPGNGGKCIAEIGQSCSGHSSTCDVSLYQICNPATLKCDCQLNTVLVGGTCHAIINKPCNTLAPNPTPDCDSSSFLECSANDICVCNGDHPLRPDGKCTAKLMESCAGTSAACDTSAFLVCSPTKVCICPTGSIANSASECKSTYNKVCNTGGMPDCGEFMNCNGTTGLCQCNEGLVVGEVNVNSCAAPFGADCDATRPCDGRGNCTEGKCACADGLVDNGFGLCRLKVGNSCSAGSATLKPCDELAVCSEGKCECTVKGVTDNGEGFCRVTVYDDPCNEDGGFHCDDRRYLYCEAESGKCKCNDGHTNHGDNFCRANLNDVCEGDVIPCDNRKNLECGVEGTCGCPEGFEIVGGACNGVGRMTGVVGYLVGFVLVVKSVM